MGENIRGLAGGLAGIAKHLEYMLGTSTSEPVERFCQMIADLPDFGRAQAIGICCLGLGWQVDPKDVLNASDRASELFRPASCLICKRG